MCHESLSVRQMATSNGFRESTLSLHAKSQALLEVGVVQLVQRVVMDVSHSSPGGGVLDHLIKGARS